MRKIIYSKFAKKSFRELVDKKSNIVLKSEFDMSPKFPMRLYIPNIKVSKKNHNPQDISILKSDDSCVLKDILLFSKNTIQKMGII